MSPESFDHRQAQEEGWGIFDVDSTGYLEIERDDEAGVFDTDDGALWYVVERARAGSGYHRQALSLIGIKIDGEPEQRPGLK